MKAYRRSITGILLVVLIMISSVIYPSKGVSAAQDLAFTSETSVMRVGEEKAFKVNQKGAKWQSSNPKVADISSKGVVTAKRTGRTQITATVNKKTISATLKVKAKYTIGIDPGHQLKGNNGTEPVGPGSSIMKTKVAGGTSGVSTRKPEYQLNLEIGLALKKELTKRGYKVVMTRETNEVDISNIERAQMLNAKCDIAIRIHADGGASSAHGASALYPSAANPYIPSLSEPSLKLSQCILDSYCQATDITKRGLSARDDLTGTNWSTIPVTLIEMGFMTNAFDDEYMSSAKGQAHMIEGLANGVDAYFAQ